MKIVVSAGGTGGHIFPAECLADEMAKRGYEVILITDNRYKNYLENKKSFEIVRIKSATISPGVIGKITSLVKIVIGTIQAFLVLKKNNIPVVVGFGGYPSFPALLAGFLAKKITIIHEQNSVLGKANLFISKFVKIIATSFREVKKIEMMQRRKVEYTGNPVRREIIEVGKGEYNSSFEKFNILVVGGSLGARVFSEVIPEAIKKLPSDFKKKLKLIQQVRIEDLERVRKSYDEEKIEFEIEPFFKDLPEKLSNTHLVIARSGASTVAELAVAGRPSVLVPIPNSIFDHQLINAKKLTELNAAWLLEQKDFTAESLSQLLTKLFSDSESLIKAADAAKKIGEPEAVKKLADLVEKAVQNGKIK